jgi:hypothetical protein
MPSTPTLEQQRQHLNRWKTLGPMLEELRAEEIRNMTDEQRAQAIEDVLDLAVDWLKRNPGYERECGMVEQQRKIRRWHELKKATQS